MNKATIHILLVEDNPGDADYLKELLSEARETSFSILHVQRLAAALSLLNEKPFDIILLDLGLPDSQGIDSLLSVRKQSSRVPVLILTALTDEEFALSAIKTGADEYLIKGNIDATLLVRSIRYTIERKRTEEALRMSETRFRNLFEQSPISMQILSPDGKVLEVNNAWAMLWGVPLQMLKDYNILLDAQLESKGVLPNIRKGFGGEASEIPAILYDPAEAGFPGRARWVKAFIYPVKDEAGRIRQVVLMQLDVTETMNAERALRDSEERYRIVTEAAQDAIFTLDVETRIVLANPAAERIFGYSRDEMEGKPLTVLVPERVRKAHRDAMEEYMTEGRHLPTGLEMPGLRKDGKEISLEISFGEFNEDGIRCFVGIVRDITGRRRTEEILLRNNAILKQAGQMASLGAWEIEISNPDDLNANPLRWSEEVYRIFGYESGGVEVTNQLFFERSHPEDRQKIIDALATAIAQKQTYSLEHRIIRPDGAERIVYEHAEITFDDQGRPVRIAGAVQDITERKKAEEMIQYQAYHDLLTGLPNRAQLMLNLDLEVAQADRNNKSLAVVHMDLDRFKIINDTLGHAIGDKVILAVAERLGKLMRTSDTLSRAGSDEFIILLANLNKPEDAARAAMEIVTAMRRIFRVNDKELYITASIGISMFPDDSREPEVLLTNADVAVSHVKTTGRNNYQFFNPSINVRTLERLLLESNLRQTVERKELVLYYQPQVNIRTGEIVCLESLVRWKHSGLGILLPMQFVPIAEEIGFITTIDEWALRIACIQNKAWHDKGYSPLCVTVNISAQQFQHPDLVDIVKNIVNETGLDPRYLDIEVTESTAMRNIDLAIPNLRGLHNLGINLSIDDFGTGYSSLNYLKRFPVQTLKIDQSFIRGLGTDADDQAIVKAVIAMGHNLRLKVLAEGVETDEQLSFLRTYDCDEMQGFLFSEPLPSEEVQKQFR